MALRARRPTTAELAALARRAGGQPLTYGPVGLSLTGDSPAGYRRDRWSRTVGHGRAAFDAAWAALRTWQVHAGAGLAVDAPPAEPGLTVALAAPMPVGWVEITCRVVAVVDEADRRGFAYGTLPVHPEQGEESFVVELRPDGAVVFDILAVARLRHPLARACPPVARHLQRSATTRYLDAMARATASTVTP